MLNRSRSKVGEGELVEGELVEGDPEIGSRRTFSRTMSSPRGEEGHTKQEKLVISETEFLEAFMSMKAMMEILLDERAERKKKEEGSSSRDAEVKPEEKGRVGGDGDPPNTNQTFSSSHTSHSNNESPNMPYFKLDVKFELPIYNGYVDTEKLDNWIKQLEVYCRVQGIDVFP